MAAADNAEVRVRTMTRSSRFCASLWNCCRPMIRKRPRLLARLGFALSGPSKVKKRSRWRRRRRCLSPPAKAAEAAAEYLEAARRDDAAKRAHELLLDAGQEGLRYIGVRRDMIWASLDEIDTYRADAEEPDNPGIMIDSPRCANAG